MAVKLTINGIAFAIDPKQTILDSLERNGIGSEYHCRDGHCGACQCKLLSGEVAYDKTPMAYVRSGHILTCCSKPKGDVELAIPGVRLPLKLTG
ncbi:class I ribonucleotide reductase maintenance protein YfaE [Motilimonas pumila]|uniref:Ferredoxin n=1 Tax=Motilimonas pumila TaxID=2303987 RepID=A0A418YGB0_9GAMM|nr:class I ribonucleotide reductase maintenance protein YfaE [Motilimonas pumila]RJG48640.1 ferredoxin [Motilimonas pumila]